MRNVLIGLCCFIPIFCNSQIITTFAGNGIEANTGDGGAATIASIDYPTGGVFDRNGNYYFTLGTHGNGVKKVSKYGILSRVAGTGIGGFGGDGGPATAAQLKTAQTVAVDTAGNILIADSENRRIRKVDITTGIINTVAGTGLVSFNGDGPALMTNIVPNNLCFDKQGNLYFSEVWRIRKLDKSGNIITVAGNGISGFGGNNVPATSVPINAYGLCFDEADNLYFADNYARIYKVNTAGIMYYFAGNGTNGYAGDGGPATAATMAPTFIKMDNSGNMFVAEMQQARVRVINTAGVIKTIVGTGLAGYNGDGIIATSAQLKFPGGITLDSCDNLYIADSHDWRIRKVTFNTPPCDYLGVNEQANPKPIAVYPNPANNELRIDNVQENSTYQLCNVVGAVMEHGYLKEGSNSIAVQQLPPGLYMLLLTDEEGKRTVHKIVKE